MPLSDLAIRAAKPGPKAIKLSDGEGLYLLVGSSGGKLWRLKYRVGGKEKKLSFGTYSDVSLKEARRRCDEAQPACARRRSLHCQKVAAIARAAEERSSFAIVGSEYLNHAAREGRESVTVTKSRCYYH